MDARGGFGKPPVAVGVVRADVSGRYGHRQRQPPARDPANHIAAHATCAMCHDSRDDRSFGGRIAVVGTMESAAGAGRRVRIRVLFTLVDTHRIGGRGLDGGAGGGRAGNDSPYGKYLPRDIHAVALAAYGAVVLASGTDMCRRRDDDGYDAARNHTFLGPRVGLRLDSARYGG